MFFGVRIKQRSLEINLPLTIAGVCSSCGGADAPKGKHEGKLEDAPHLRGHDNYHWSKLVPEFYSVETIWVDSALAAFNDLNQNQMLEINQIRQKTSIL